MKIESQRPRGPLPALVGFGAAAVFAFFVLPFAARGTATELVGSSEYRTWQVLVVLQACLWIFGVAYTLEVWKRTTTGFRRPGSAVAALVLLWLLTALPYSLDYFFGSVTGFDWTASRVLPRFFIASGSGVLASVLVGAGIIRIQELSRAWLADGVDVRTDLASYRQLAGFLDRHLLILSGILTGAVVGTQASREAVHAIEESYPQMPEQVWQLAIYWSALLAVVYTASSRSLRRVGYRLREQMLSNLELAPADAKWLAKEKELNELLGLDKGYLAELQSALKVVTPIAGAIASQLI